MGAALLPVTSSTDIKKNKSKLLSVQEILWYALLTSVVVAVTLGVTAAIVFSGTHILIPIPSTLQPPELTPAQEAEVDSFGFGLGFLWLSVPQATAATVGLLLPRRCARARWSLALAAMVPATVAHYICTRITLFVIAANPGHIGYDILGCGGWAFVLGFDLLCLISLLIGIRRTGVATTSSVVPI